MMLQISQMPTFLRIPSARHVPVPGGALFMGKPRADRGQLGKAVNRLSPGPTDSSEQKKSEERIIEGPAEMAGNAHEDTPGIHLAHPHQRPGHAFLDSVGDALDVTRITRQGPITLVCKTGSVKAG